MTLPAELHTERLIMRCCNDSDLPAFAAMNADEAVMAFFPKRLNREESDALMRRVTEKFAANGWGFWVVDIKPDIKLPVAASRSRTIGFVGLNNPDVTLPFSPCTEIGWRLDQPYWGYGFATEAAHRALQFAFEQLTLDEVVSFAVVDNHPSRAVMERIGLINTQRNFMHPALPTDSPLAEHVLYKISASQWAQSQ